MKVTDDIAFFHGMPRNYSEWSFPEDVFSPSKLDQVTVQSASLAFWGDNHLAGLHTKTSKWKHQTFTEIGDDWITAEHPSTTCAN